MKAYDNGAYFTVSCSERDLDAFRNSYPCSGIVARRLSFQFDKRNGDLVDIWPESTSSDGPALLALSHDAQSYGAKRLKLTL